MDPNSYLPPRSRRGATRNISNRNNNNNNDNNGGRFPPLASCSSSNQNASTSVWCFQFEALLEYINGKRVQVDLTSSDKDICVDLALLAIHDTNRKYHGYGPDLELDQVIAASARRFFDGRISFIITINARELCNEGLDGTFDCFVLYSRESSDLNQVIGFIELNVPPPPELRSRPVRSMTYEEYLLYQAQVSTSDGFDVASMPGIYVTSHIQPLNLSYQENMDHCEKLARFVILTFNFQMKDTEGELDYGEVVKVMHQLIQSSFFYITFKAVDLKNQQTNTYQAIVESNGYSEDQVLCCRLKPGLNNAVGRWFWDYRECGGSNTQGM